MKYYDLGMSHGISGVLAFISICKIHGVDINNQTWWYYTYINLSIHTNIIIEKLIYGLVRLIWIIKI